MQYSEVQFTIHQKSFIYPLRFRGLESVDRRKECRHADGYKRSTKCSTILWNVIACTPVNIFQILSTVHNRI